MPLNLPIIRVFVLFVALFSFGLSGCNEQEDIQRPDVSHIAIDTEIRRFDQAMMALDTNAMEAEMERINETYGEFATLYFGQILGAFHPHIAPEGPETYIKGFISHELTHQLYDTIQVVYPDLDREKVIFDQAFRLWHDAFPDRPIPKVTTFFSEFSMASFVYGEDELAVGLDFYLGEGYPYAKIDPTNPVFSNYLTRSYNRDHLVPRTLKPLVEDLVGPVPGNQLLDHILHNGKILYLLDYLLPEVSDTAIFAYTPDQLAWCRENERNIYGYFASENLLYNTEWKLIRKYVDESPHSPGMPEQAPGRTGDFVGYQMIRSLIKKQPEMTLKDVMSITDTAELLKLAHYKPPR